MVCSAWTLLGYYCRSRTFAYVRVLFFFASNSACFACFSFFSLPLPAAACPTASYYAPRSHTRCCLLLPAAAFTRLPACDLPHVRTAYFLRHCRHITPTLLLRHYPAIANLYGWCARSAFVATLRRVTTHRRMNATARRTSLYCRLRSTISFCHCAAGSVV